MTSSSHSPAHRSIDQPGDPHTWQNKCAPHQKPKSVIICFFHILYCNVLTNCSIFNDLNRLLSDGNSCGNWTDNKMLKSRARASRLIFVFVVFGCDRRGFMRQILLPDCGFLKFIEHSITSYELLTRRAQGEYKYIMEI